MKNLKLVLWVFIIWLIETVFLRFIKIGGIAPDLLYVFILCLAYREREPKVYIFAAALCGILAETTGHQCIGFQLILFVCSVFLVVMLGELIYKNFFVLIVPISGVFSFAANSLYYALNSEVMNSLTYVKAIETVILPVSVYNTAVAMAVLFLLDMTVYKGKKSFGR